MAARSLRFTVLGLPQPQGSAKAVPMGKRFGVVADNEKVLRPWRVDVAETAKRELEVIGGPLVGPVKVSVTFRFRRPSSHFGVRGMLLPSAPAEKVTRPDGDKLERAVFDSLSSAGIWRDDSYVVECTWRKEFAGIQCAQIQVEEVGQ